MKKIGLLLLVIQPFLLVNSYAQDEKRWMDVMETACSDSIETLLKELEPDESKIAKNDTTSAISSVVNAVFCAYKEDRLNGYTKYKEYTQWPRRIVVQPEIEVCFIPEIDYRSVFERKYFVCKSLLEFEDWDLARMTGSRLDQYLPYHNDVPNLSNCKKYRYFKPNNTDQCFVLDTLIQIRLEKLSQKHAGQWDSKKIGSILPVSLRKISTGVNNGKTFISFYYNFWIYKIIFNPMLDQCIVQMSTTQAPYELFLLKIQNKWVVAYSAEWIHFD